MPYFAVQSVYIDNGGICICGVSQKDLTVPECGHMVWRACVRKAMEDSYGRSGGFKWPLCNYAIASDVANEFLRKAGVR